MNTLKKGLTVFCIALLAACSSQSYKKTDNSVQLTIDTLDVTLSVISPEIIRVTATPKGAALTDTSLIVLKQQVYTNWEVAQEGNNIIVSTSKISAILDAKTGEVCFKDADGTVLLQEKIGGGKIIHNSTTEGADYYTVQQVFESPDDEAFYGLGAQHHRYMNYKGKDVELAQHNLVSCVPFLYSNKGYGILWDNYSITRFGDAREYQDISNLLLFDTQKNAGGLTATHMVQGKVVNIIRDTIIDYMFEEEAGKLNLPKELDQKGTIVWEGYVGSEVEGEHKFLLYGSNYIKVYVNNELIIDCWRQNWNPWSRPFQIDMKQGEIYAIKIEWIPNGGYLALKHLDPLPVQDQMRLSLFSEAAYGIDYYFVYGKTSDEVISGYRKLTGKATMIPKWAMGFWQSRERYKTQDELVDVVQTFRNKKIPLDNIVLDWNYWPDNQWGSHLFDSTRFANPVEMVSKVHDLNARIMISVWPKYYEGIDNYVAMNEKGYVFQHNIEKARLDWIYPGYKNTFYDVFNPGARDMFWDQIKTELFDKGFDAWWLDATEPDMHSNISIEERKLNMTPNYLGNGEQYFNAYSLMNALGVYESQRKTDPNTRVFILTRSSFAGQQRYAAVNWSGDIVSRWSDLYDQITVGTNHSISGLPYWTMDIGGFAIEDKYWEPKGNDLVEWRELNTRWYQFGAFCPLFRVHGQYPFREIYNIAPEGHPAYASMLYYNKLRYTLMPYIYTLAGDSYHKDYTIMRPLVMDFAHDTKVLNIDNQYMFGPSFLVNPVTEFKAKKRDVYLPDGQAWYDLYTGNVFHGGQTISADAPYERMPVFVKEGSIIPTGVDMQYTNQYPDSVITLYVYAGKDASFELYADESTNYNYEKGKYSYVPISYNESTGTLTIGERRGVYDGMLQNQMFKIVYINAQNPVAFGNESAIVSSITYSGSQISTTIK